MQTIMLIAGSQFQNVIVAKVSPKGWWNLGTQQGLSHICYRLLGMAKGISPNLKKDNCLLPDNLHVIASYWPNTWTTIGYSPNWQWILYETLPFDVYLHLALGQILLIKSKRSWDKGTLAPLAKLLWPSMSFKIMFHHCTLTSVINSLFPDC